MFCSVSCLRHDKQLSEQIGEEMSHRKTGVAKQTAELSDCLDIQTNNYSLNVESKPMEMHIRPIDSC